MAGETRRTKQERIDAIKKADAGVKIMDDFTDPDELYQVLIAGVRKYHPSDDISMIEKAYKVAYNAHKDQKRKSGEPYIIHPLCVAIILADLELDKESIVAGLLHDVVEDTVMTLDELKEEFGDDVATIVDGVTKLGKLPYSADKLEEQAENLRKMFLAMAKDIRVLMVKLADRLHNMRTLQYMTPEKQREKSQETMDIYAPLAHRLGISKIKTELDDLSLKYLQPDVYYDLVEKIAMKKDERQAFVDQIVAEVSSHIEEAGIREAQIDGRFKHFFSIYKKMHNQHKTLDQIYDLFAVRIIVDTVSDCYAALGVIHSMYKPVPGRFKDYIAMPKSNMYQSLHTTLIGPGGVPFEIQIRTFEMHRAAEYGIAAHWKYKEAADGKKSDTSKEAEKLLWMRQLLDYLKSDNQEFMSLLRNDFDLLSESVYCFTPRGEVKSLPNGSTPIDFAYSIHSKVGNKMIGARVNGKLVTIDYMLQNGDRVEIVTSQNSRGPSRDWLKVVKSSQARNKINQWFKKELKEDNIVRGKELLSSYCKTNGIDQSALMKPEYEERVLQKYGFRDWDAVLAAVGHGGLKEGQVVNKLLSSYKQESKKKNTDEQIIEAVNTKKPMSVCIKKGRSGITVRGTSDVSVRCAKCCSPIPGDEIVGYVTRGRGVVVHRTDCKNMLTLPEEERTRLIDAEWQSDGTEADPMLFMVGIAIYCNDRTGLLGDITQIFTEEKINVSSVNSRTSKQKIATIAIAFSITDKPRLQQLVERIRQVRGVLNIERTNG